MKDRDTWDITVNQLVNGMYDVETYILHDSAFEDDPDGVELTFSSPFKPCVILQPKYAFAKVKHCEIVDTKTLRVYIEITSEVAE